MLTDGLLYKLDAIKTVVDALVTAGRSEFENVSDSHTGDTDYQTLIDISDAGVLHDINAYTNNTDSALVTVKVTIDGEVLTSNNGSHTAPQGLQPQHSTSLVFTGTNYLAFHLGWEYKTGLKVEYKTTVATGTAYCTVNYGHDT